MSSCFAVNERKAQTQMTPASTPARTALQRKCACGGQCSSCQEKHNHRGGIPHNFGEVNVHAPSGGRLYDAAFPGRLSETENGDTGCDVSKGIPDISLNQPSLCFKDCTERHESVHKKDIADCCKKANKAWTNAKDDKKDDVQDKMNRWVLDNRSWLECRAYAESVKCATEFLEANCGSRRSETGDDAPLQLYAGKDSGYFPANDASTDGQQGIPSATVLAEEKSGDAKPDDGKPATDEPKPIDPARCCATVRDYRFHAKARGEAYCKDATKNLTTCPF